MAPPVPDHGFPVSVPLVVDDPLVPELEALELEAPDAGGVVGAELDDDEDDPPGTTSVSFSFVTSPGVDGALAPSPVVPMVVSFSQAESNKAASSTNR